MKKSSFALLAVAILMAVIFAFSFSEKDVAKNASLSKTQDAEKQSAALGRDSFHIKEPADKGKGNSETKAMIDRSKAYLLTQVGNRLSQLLPFKARIETMVAPNSTKLNSILADLNTEIKAFEAFKLEIAKMETKQDVSAVTEKVKAEWLKTQQSVKRAEAEIISAKENQLIDDADTLALGLQKRIDVLKASGKGSKDYEKLLSEYGKKLADAKQNVELANEKYNAVATSTTNVEKNNLIKDKDLLLKDAQEDVREAYKLISKEARKDFMRKYGDH